MRPKLNRFALWMYAAGAAVVWAASIWSSLPAWILTILVLLIAGRQKMRLEAAIEKMEHGG